MKYIPADKMIAEIEHQKKHLSRGHQDELGAIIAYEHILSFIESLQQEQPVTKEQISHLEHWLAFFGCPEENIEKCATQIAQNYDAIRYLEGVQRGAEAVNELAQQEQPEVDLVEEITRFFSKNPIPHEHITDWPLLKNTAIHFYELGLNARKEE